jgi:hypothetical protein
MVAATTKSGASESKSSLLEQTTAKQKLLALIKRMSELGTIASLHWSRLNGICHRTQQLTRELSGKIVKKLDRELAIVLCQRRRLGRTNFAIEE